MWIGPAVRHAMRFVEIHNRPVRALSRGRDETNVGRGASVPEIAGANLHPICKFDQERMTAETPTKVAASASTITFRANAVDFPVGRHEGAVIRVEIHRKTRPMVLRCAGFSGMDRGVLLGAWMHALLLASFEIIDRWHGDRLQVGDRVAQVWFMTSERHSVSGLSLGGRRAPYNFARTF